MLEYAPLDQRYRHIIQRLPKIPALLEQAPTNLLDAPEVWNRVAREENDGNMDLIDKTLRAKVPPALEGDYDHAAGPALDALRGFTQFLKDDLSKQDQRLAAGQGEVRPEVRATRWCPAKRPSKCSRKPKPR